MKLMDFGGDHKIGLKKIDEQHADICETLNYIYDIKDHDKKEILEAFDQLLSKLKYHFETEENLMKENKVVHFISHKLEHDRAFLKYSDYYGLFKNGNETFDAEILVSLKNWIENHLVKKDMKLQALISRN